MTRRLVKARPFRRGQPVVRRDRPSAVRRRPPEADLVSQSRTEPLTAWDLVDVPEDLVFSEAPTFLEVELGRALRRRRRRTNPRKRTPEWLPPQRLSDIVQVRVRDGYAVATRDLGNGVYLVAPLPNGAMEDTAVRGEVGNALVRSIMKSLTPLIEAAAAAAARKKAAKAAAEASQVPDVASGMGCRDCPRCGR